MSKNTGRALGNESLRLPWGKGRTGNPKGRHFGAKDGIRARLRRALNKAPCPEVLTVLKDKGLRLPDKTNAGAIAAIMIETAINGDVQAIKMIMEQTEVPLKTEVDVDMKGKMDHTVKRLNIHFVDAGDYGKPNETNSFPQWSGFE